MYVFKKRSIILGQIFIISLWIAICAFIITKFNLKPLVSTLLVLSGGGLIMLVNPLLKPIVKLKKKKLEKDQRILDRHIQIAKKQGKKSYGYGPVENGVKKHTVWAVNKLKADKLYNLHVAPKTIKNKTKAYYYISPVCHNLKD
jgi:hypothetical protein